MQFIRSGWQIGFSICIDFTISNGPTSEPTSLHYIDNRKAKKVDYDEMNPYQKAIYSLTSLLQHYDHDKKFPVFGFGGIPSYEDPAGEANHCFALKDPSDAVVSYVQEAMDLYKEMTPKITFHGPTLLAPCLSTLMEAYYEKFNMNEYSVILILTDGIVNDVADTKRILVELSNMPVSVIIIGIGDADFKVMEQFKAKTPIVNSSG